MKLFTVTAWFTNGRTDFFQSTDLAVARRVFEQWRADIQSVYVAIN